MHLQEQDRQQEKRCEQVRAIALRLRQEFVGGREELTKQDSGEEAVGEVVTEIPVQSVEESDE